MPIQNTDDTIIIQKTKPGWEALPIGASLPFDLNADGDHIGLDAAGEIAGTSLFVYAAYSSLLRYLDLEPAVRAGHITRKDQYQQSLKAAWQASKDNSVKVLVVAVLLTLMPGLGPVVGFASIFGVGVMSVRIVKAFHRALSPEMRDNLRNAADKAGVKMKGINDDSDLEPLPTC